MWTDNWLRRQMRSYLPYRLAKLLGAWAPKEYHGGGAPMRGPQGRHW